MSEKSKLGRFVTPSTVNRELAVLRHLLRLAEEWGYIEKVPPIRLAEGRLRFLDEDELVRLLAASEAKASKSPVLLPVVTVAVNTGMRKGELFGLAWERVGHATLAMTMRYAHLAKGHLRKAMDALSFSTSSAHDAKIEAACRVNSDAPVAQVDRAAVS